MEKMMVVGLAILFAMMTAVPPRPVKMPPRPAPINGQNDIETVTSNNPKVVSDNTKPVKVNEKAELLHDPR